MRQVRRPRGLAVLFRRRRFLDLRSFLRGRVIVTTEDRPVVASLLDGREHDLDPDEAAVLLRVPSDRWLPVDEGDGDSGSGAAPRRAVVEALAERGLLLSDADDGRSVVLRRREEAMAALAWDPYAALYHYMTRWERRGSDLKELVDLDSGRFVGLPEEDPFGFGRRMALYGPPPPAFYERPDAEAVVPLPRAREDHPLFDVLRRRRTVRFFDRRKSLDLDDLATVLFQVFGCHATWEAHPGFDLVRRTSPSGGSLHPIEAYPLVRRVEGLEPGLYHYAMGQNALERLRSLTEEQVVEMAERFTAGQVYFGTAQVLVVLTARFYRTFWKYREQEKAYRVLCMDAAHLSQTLYLVATALELGAFVTAAIADREIERELGLDAVEEGALAIVGCGVPREGDHDLGFAVGPPEVPEPLS